MLERTLVRRRNNIAMLLLLFCVGFAREGFRTESVVESGVHWFPALCSFSLLSISIGVWFAREWARWACGVVGLLFLAGYALAVSPTEQNLDLFRSIPGRIGFITVLLFAGLWTAIGIYCLRPSTRAHFAAARELRACAVQ